MESSGTPQDAAQEALAGHDQRVRFHLAFSERRVDVQIPRGLIDKESDRRMGTEVLVHEQNDRLQKLGHLGSRLLVLFQEHRTGKDLRCTRIDPFVGSVR